MSTTLARPRPRRHEVRRRALTSRDFGQLPASLAFSSPRLTGEGKGGKPHTRSLTVQDLKRQRSRLRPSSSDPAGHLPRVTGEAYGSKFVGVNSPAVSNISR